MVIFEQEYMKIKHFLNFKYSYKDFEYNCEPGYLLDTQRNDVLHFYYNDKQYLYFNECLFSEILDFEIDINGNIHWKEN